MNPRFKLKVFNEVFVMANLLMRLVKALTILKD